LLTRGSARLLKAGVATLAAGMVAVSLAAPREKVATPALPLPSASVLPQGVLNPLVRQDNISSTICKPGWSSEMRKTVAAQIQAYRLKHLPSPSPSTVWILDHTIAIELGGATFSPDNLQFQTKSEAARKDHQENLDNTAVCTKKMTLQEAQDDMWYHWRS
jgi:hypothetical protein